MQLCYLRNCIQQQNTLAAPLTNTAIFPLATFELLGRAHISNTAEVYLHITMMYSGLT